jgi:hypothetical protein
MKKKQSRKRRRMADSFGRRAAAFGGHDSKPAGIRIADLAQGQQYSKEERVTVAAWILASSALAVALLQCLTAYAPAVNTFLCHIWEIKK